MTRTADTIDLLKTYTADYMPTAYWSGFHPYRRFPGFSLGVVLAMLTDPRVLLGLGIIKGVLLTKMKIRIDCDSQPVQDFLQRQLTRFLSRDAPIALKAVEWGYSCSEVFYKIIDGQLHYWGLRDLHPMDCRCLVAAGKVIGARIRGLKRGSATDYHRSDPLLVPKIFWHVQSRDFHPWYGRSRLFGAFIPWNETWSDGGFRDIRRLWFYKYAYDGGIGYHPPGTTRIAETGQEISNRDLMREIMEKRRTGGIVVLPDNPEGGKRLWEILPPTPMPLPSGLMEYGEQLRVEILEGMGIPPEVVQAAQVGSGYSGRRVPEEAFYCSLQQNANELINDLDQQVLRFLVRFNFKTDVPYELTVYGLLAEEETPERVPEPPLAETQPDLAEPLPLAERRLQEMRTTGG